MAVEIEKKIEELGIVPVVVLQDIKDAKPLAQALCEGGLPCAEVTFRTEAAEESIRIMTEAFPQMLVGAGTVLTKAQVDAAVEAGANLLSVPVLILRSWITVWKSRFLFSRDVLPLRRLRRQTNCWKSWMG